MKAPRVADAKGKDIGCQICNGDMEIVAGYEKLRRITSDCKPWPAGGTLAICQTCGCLQKPLDQAWGAQVQEVYENYSIYHQGRGCEQAVYEDISGRAMARSVRLLEHVLDLTALPETGLLLDIGCGNGGLLRSFNGLRPKWLLAGTELNDKYRQAVEGLKGVRAFYSGPFEEIDQKFDLITLVHVLEHVPAPKDFLRVIAEKLRPQGQLIVQVPEYTQNPFDLAILDHCYHFTEQTIEPLLREAGYELLHVSRQWIPKELSLVLRVNKGPSAQKNLKGLASIDLALKRLAWLELLIKEAGRLSHSSSFGLFGTSIAATWLFSELEGKASYFVDEDVNRCGHLYMNRPVYHPRDIPPGGDVFLALPPNNARSVERRLSRPDIKLHLPPFIE